MLVLTVKHNHWIQIGDYKFYIKKKNNIASTVVFDVPKEIKISRSVAAVGEEQR